MKIKLSYKRIYIFLLIIHFPIFCLSQQNNFRTYTIEEGLPQSTIFDIKQDMRGYLWIGTNGGGVCRFDGLSFITFSKKNGLSGNIVRCIEEDSKGRLWIGTDHGLNLYDGYQFQLIGKDEGISDHYILSIYEDSKGTIWAGTSGGGLNKIYIDDKDSINVTNFTKKDKLISNHVFDIVEDNYNRIWLAMLGGINILSFEDNEVNIKKLHHKVHIPSNFILCAEKDEKGNLWFGTKESGAFMVNMSGADSGMVQIINFKSEIETVWDILTGQSGIMWFATDKNGIIQLNLTNSLKPIIKHYSNKHGLPDNQTLALYQDLEKNIWIGTNGNGLVKFMGDHFAHYTLKDGLPNKQIFDIEQDVNGKYWIATYGGGLVKFNGEDDIKFQVFSKSSGLNDNYLSSLSASQNGDIWIASSNNGIYKYDGNKFVNYTTKNGLVNNSVYSIFVDSRESVWCGTQGGISMFDGDKFINFTEFDGLIHNEVQTIIEDKEGKIWIGTMGGLACTDRNIMTDFDETDGLSEKRIQALACDNNNNIWIGTFGSGLFIHEKNNLEKAAVRFVADAELLSSNNVYSLLFANDSVLIVGTDNGFDKLEINEKLEIEKIKNYSKLEGFTGIENNLNAIYKDNFGKIWFGTVKGLTRYDPTKEYLNLSPPKTHITQLYLFFENIDWGLKSDSLKPWFSIPTGLKLPHSNNHLTFRFSAISLKNPEKIRYKYILEGLDEKWSPPITENLASYPGLIPGKYTFKVIAGNENGIWNTVPIQFGFTIKPPFWQRWWFYLSCIIFIVVSVILYIRYRERKLRQQKIILEQKVQERTLEIRKQHKKIEEQKQELEIKNKNITDSIQYAKRIQRAVLPQKNILEDHFAENFILFRPKDIVSGDFYWMSKMNGKLIVSVADCTGHGVPGAFMSMLGLSFLNKIVNEQGITQPNLILNQLRQNVINALQQKGILSESKDGMDISLCTIDFENKKLHYAGANNPLYLIRKINGEYKLIEKKADRMPVAIHDTMDDFKSQEIDLFESDSIYMFSDGFVDQFGGPEGRKFMKKRFKEMLLNHQDKSMSDQQKQFEYILDEWTNYSIENSKPRGQIDDILVLGIKV